MTKREIDQVLPFWQKILRLEDWRITARTAPAAEMGDCDGLNFLHPEEMLSEILLRRGASEETLVHEMLHVVFEGDTGLKTYDALYERGINRAAAALVMLAYPEKYDERFLPIP